MIRETAELDWVNDNLKRAVVELQMALWHLDTLVDNADVAIIHKVRLRDEKARLTSSRNALKQMMKQRQDEKVKEESRA